MALRDGKAPPGFQLDAIVAGTQERIRQFQERGRLLRGILTALGNFDAVRALVETTETPEGVQASVMELLGIDQGPGQGGTGLAAAGAVPAATAADQR